MLGVPDENGSDAPQGKSPNKRRYCETQCVAVLEVLRLTLEHGCLGHATVGSGGCDSVASAPCGPEGTTPKTRHDGARRRRGGHGTRGRAEQLGVRVPGARAVTVPPGKGRWARRPRRRFHGHGSLSHAQAHEEVGGEAECRQEDRVARRCQPEAAPGVVSTLTHHPTRVDSVLWEALD